MFIVILQKRTQTLGIHTVFNITIYNFVCYSWNHTGRRILCKSDFTENSYFTIPFKIKYGIWSRIYLKT